MNATSSLVKLQDVDTQLLEISELLGDLPVKVEELTKEEQQLKEDINQRKDRMKEIDLEVSKKDLLVQDLTSKIDKLKDQLFLVKTNRQYDAISHEIDFRKEKLNNIDLSKDIQDFISSEIKTNVREIVGAVNRIISFSRIL